MPPRLQEIVPLNPVVEKYHDASEYADGGVVIPIDAAVSRYEQNNPILWRATFPEEDILKGLVSTENPKGDITNSDLELASGVISNEAAAQNFDIRERIVHSNTDNTLTMFWLLKGSTTTANAPAHLLRAQALHQRFHRYVHCIDFVRGEHNDISDIPSRKTEWSDEKLLTCFNLHYPQPLSWKLWTPPPELLSCMAMCLHRKPFPRESLLQQPPTYVATGATGPSTAPQYPSTHFSRGTKTKSSGSVSMLMRTEQVPYHPISGAPCTRNPLKMPYA